MAPVGAAMTKDLVRPLLQESFADFSVKFTAYLNRLSAGQGPLTDDMKLPILKGGLAVAGRLELQRWQGWGEKIR